MGPRSGNQRSVLNFTGMPDRVANKPISMSVGDYLKAIWSTAGTGSASTNALSKRLSVAPASVSSMLVRLREMGFVGYEAYYGASLTESGRREVRGELPFGTGWRLFGGWGRRVRLPTVFSFPARVRSVSAERAAGRQQ